jgi:hypothetical protein
MKSLLAALRCVSYLLQVLVKVTTRGACMSGSACMRTENEC